MKALLARIYRHMPIHNKATVDKEVNHLICGAFFFATMSCEYTLAGNSNQRTTTVRLKDICFYFNKRLLPHSSLLLHVATLVVVTFHLQKRVSEVRETIFMHRTQCFSMNPVSHWEYNMQ